MNLLISTILAIVPIAYLLIHFYKKDNLRPEPKGLIFKVFIWGVLSTFLALILEILLESINIFSFFPLLFIGFKAFIVAGLVEEWTKLLVVKKTVYKNSRFDEVMDGIVYTVTASLGFAFLENIIYVLGSGITTAVLRGVTAVPMHAFMSGIMGYYIGAAKFAKDSNEEKRLMNKGLMLAILFHGTYDFLIMILKVVPSAAIIVVILIIFELVYSGRHLKSLIIKAKKGDLASGRV